VIARIAPRRRALNRGSLDHQTRSLVGSRDGGVRGPALVPEPTFDDLLRADLHAQRRGPVRPHKTQPELGQYAFALQRDADTQLRDEVARARWRGGVEHVVMPREVVEQLSAAVRAGLTR
jgi:hypothetical protein